MISLHPNFLTKPVNSEMKELVTNSQLSVSKLYNPNITTKKYYLYWKRFN